MATVSVSHAILFIASMVVAAGVAGILVVGVDNVGDSLDDRTTQVSQTIDTDIQIISDTGSPETIYTGDTIELFVKNTGDNNLPAAEQEVTVLVDGQIVTDMTVEQVDGDISGWPSGSVVRVTVHEVSGEPVDVSGDTRVQVRVNQNTDTIEFRVD